MSHFYTAEGELVPQGTKGSFVSPTTFLSIVRKPELDEWKLAQAERIGVAQMSQNLQDSSERGTRIHAACEQIANEEDAYGSETAGALVEEDMALVEGFCNWLGSRKEIKILETELFVVSHRYGYAGTIDLVAEIDGDLWIIDLKTGRDDYMHGLQLKAYEQAYFELTDRHARMGVLGLTPRNKSGYRRVKEYAEPIHAVLVHLYTWEWHQSKKPKVKVDGPSYIATCPICQATMLTGTTEKAHALQHMSERAKEEAL